MTDRTMLKIDFEEGMSFPDFKQFKAAALSRAVYDRAVIRFPSSDLNSLVSATSVCAASALVRDGT